jgi:Caspase domain
MMHKRRSLPSLLAVLLTAAGLFSQQPRGVTLAPTQVTTPQRGTYYALVIGINSYRDFPTLKTPLNDATEIARVLKNRYGFVTTLLPDATRDQIIDALGEYTSKLREEDSLLIYYAGHGWRDKAADDAYWIPSDGKKNSRSHWITRPISPTRPGRSLLVTCLSSPIVVSPEHWRSVISIQPLGSHLTALFCSKSCAPENRVT